MKKYTTRQIGDLGENIACRYLVVNGFSIFERNYWRKWGELDIIALKDDIPHFFEVKSLLGYGKQYRPEENVSPGKVKRLRRTIQTYLLEHREFRAKDFSFHIISVHINLQTGKYQLEMLENIIL